jgi:hypothetical protein
MRNCYGVALGLQPYSHIQGIKDEHKVSKINLSPAAKVDCLRGCSQGDKDYS